MILASATEARNLAARRKTNSLAQQQQAAASNKSKPSNLSLRKRTRALKKEKKQPIEAASVTNNKISDSAASSSIGGANLVLASFPQTGTATITHALVSNNVPVDEQQCAMTKTGWSDVRVRKELQAAATRSAVVQCDSTLYHFTSLARLQETTSKMLIGLDHPVRMIEGMYNQRVQETVAVAAQSSVPSFANLMKAGAKPWKGISLAAGQYELFLSQLGRAPLSMDELNALMDSPYELAVTPLVNADVFVYLKDQVVNEKKAGRAAQFRQTLADFLDLETSFRKFTEVDEAPIPTLDICKAEYAAIRATLVQQGAKTAAWLRGHFLPKVTLANKEHVSELLDTWSQDPCSTTTATKR